jgi:iron complex outermembrane recepter protein
MNTSNRTRIIYPRLSAALKVAHAVNVLGFATAAALASSAASAATPDAAQAQMVEEITVTSSRLGTTGGFDAPTPTTTIGAEDIVARGLPNIADYLNELPAFLGTGTPTARSFYTSSLGLNTLDLRGLGDNRTLVLVNGRRHVPTTAEGAVDINTIPMAIIQRVEVVTGGASAAWGSDAIAGVVNILLDDQFEGLRTSTQYGSSTRGDAESTHASIAYGSSIADGAGHMVIAAEYQTNNGIGSQRARAIGREGWALIPNPDDTDRNDGIAANMIARNAGLLIGSEGGHVLYPGPIGGIKFGPGGTLQPYNFGELVSRTWVVGGDGGFVDSQLVPDTDRKNLMATVRRDLSDKVEMFFEGSYAESSGASNIVPPFDFPITIQADNPFVPADFKALLDANGLTSFDLFRLNTDHGFIHTTQKVETATAVIGLKGQFGSGWSWDVYGQYGQTTNLLFERNMLVQNRLDAVDAVVAPTGEIVCRATLTGGARGCAPLNLFGTGSPSQAAIDYVMGDAFSRQQFTQHVAAATLRGELFEGWAGPVAIALGAEYREDQVERKVDEHSANGDFLISNYQPIEGTIDVSEVFLETGVPLLSDKPLVKSLDLNAAVRYTDYSTSGTVYTWKIGATYAPIDDIRLRGTLSRDIRSPNVSELFTQGALNFLTINDPFTNTSPFIRILAAGNPALTEEAADTTTIGIVLQPSFAPGLRASVDWYDIKLKDRIGSLDPQETLDLCFAGDAALCSLVTRDANGQIVEMSNTLLNIAESRYSGVDFELQYRQGLQELFSKVSGDLTFKLWGTYVEKMEFSPNGIDTLDRAGSLGVIEGSPRWRWEGTLGYDDGPFGFVTSVRYIGEGKYNANFTAEDLNAQDNSVDAEIYVNMSARYDLQWGDTSAQLFLGVNNVFDNAAQPLPDSFISQRPTNAVLYDVLGRYVYGGVRLRF